MHYPFRYDQLNSISWSSAQEMMRNNWISKHSFDWANQIGLYAGKCTPLAQRYKVWTYQSSVWTVLQNIFFSSLMQHRGITANECDSNAQKRDLLSSSVLKSRMTWGSSAKTRCSHYLTTSPDSQGKVDNEILPTTKNFKICVHTTLLSAAEKHEERHMTVSMIDPDKQSHICVPTKRLFTYKQRNQLASLTARPASSVWMTSLLASRSLFHKQSESSVFLHVFGRNVCRCHKCDSIQRILPHTFSLTSP